MPEWRRKVSPASALLPDPVVSCLSTAFGIPASGFSRYRWSSDKSGITQLWQQPRDQQLLEQQPREKQPMEQ